MSQVTEVLWQQYEAFARRDLSEFNVLYLFVDGIMQASLPGPAERAAIEAQIRDRPVEEALEAATATLGGAR